MTLSAVEKIERGKELTPARLLAFELWKENPQITAAELDKALKEKGFEVVKTTYSTWLTRFKKGSAVRTYEGKPLTSVKPGEITLEQIIKAAGGVEALSLLFYQGVMKELKRRDSALDVLKQDCLRKDDMISQLKKELKTTTNEKHKIIRMYNEKMAKLKMPTLTLAEVEHRLIPKRNK